jgi:histone H3/H4
MQNNTENKIENNTTDTMQNNTENNSGNNQGENIQNNAENNLGTTEDQNNTPNNTENNTPNNTENWDPIEDDENKNINENINDDKKIPFVVFQRLALRAGVPSISKNTHNELQSRLELIISELISKCVIIMNYSRSSTLTNNIAIKVIQSLPDRVSFYGQGNDKPKTCDSYHSKIDPNKNRQKYVMDKINYWQNETKVNGKKSFSCNVIPIAKFKRLVQFFCKQLNDVTIRYNSRGLDVIQIFTEYIIVEWFKIAADFTIVRKKKILSLQDLQMAKKYTLKSSNF